MALEREDVKSILLIIRNNGKFKLSGFVRQVDSNGDSTMRISNQNLTAVTFDNIEFIEPPSSGENTEISLTHLSGDYADTTIS